MMKPQNPIDSSLADRATLTPVSPNDFEELATLRIAAMRESLEHVGRFDPERARERLRKSFSPEHSQIIVLDGARIGFCTFRPSDDAYHLDHFYVHPDAQSQGVGAFVLRMLLKRSDALRLPVLLGALRDSASNRFYQRHGFVQTGEDEWDTYYSRPSSDPILPADIVQQQLDAYNAHDLDALMSTYAEDARLFEHPNTLLASGKAEIRERFRQRLAEPNLHAKLLHRVVMGAFVIDHELVARTFPEGAGTVQLVATYEVRDGWILNAWFLSGEKQLDS